MKISYIQSVLALLLLVSNAVLAQTVKDIDGNTYTTVTIGEQTWIASNLRVTKYPDGTPILKITENDAWGENEDSNNHLNAAFCWYENDSASYSEKYGALYTWQAAMGFREGSSFSAETITQGICPNGWHLPSQQEWDDLKTYLTNNGYSNQEMPLRSTTDWPEDYNGTDPYGFNAYPVDGRNGVTGVFFTNGYNAFFWTSTERNEITAYKKYIRFHGPFLGSGYNIKSSGSCVRCIKNNATSVLLKKEQVIDDLVIYPNPAKDYINIDYQNLIEIQLINQAGKTVLSSTQNSINTAELPQGIYVALIKTTTGIYQTKLIKH